MRSGRSPKAPRNAAMAANGFLRTKDDARLNDTSTTVASCARSKSALVATETTGGTMANGGGTILMRPVSRGSTAAAVKREGTLIWLTQAAAGRHSGGTSGISHAQ